MPNYAIPSTSGVSPWMSYYRDRYAALPELSKLAFGFEPQVGYENLLGSLNASNAQEEAMRRLYSTFWNRYNVFAASSPEGSNTSWGDWLGNQDFDRELARYSPQFRGENSFRFDRPARYIAF